MPEKDLLVIEFCGTVEKVQTMAAGQYRVYLDLDVKQVVAAVRLLAAAGETHLLFDVVMTEVEAADHRGARRKRRPLLPD